MDTGVYIRRSHDGIALLASAVVFEDWDDIVYYVVEREQLVAVKLATAENESAPYDYAAGKNRSDTRAFDLTTPLAR